MSELKPEVEYVIKTGRHVVEKKQVDFPDTLNKQLDAIKQQYNDLGAQVLAQWLLWYCLLHNRGLFTTPINTVFISPSSLPLSPFLVFW